MNFPTLSSDIYKIIFVKNHLDCIHKYFEDDIEMMLEYLIDNKYVIFRNQVFQQSFNNLLEFPCVQIAHHC